MSNHLHLIISAKENNVSDVLGDFKKFTSKQLVKSIIEHPGESRKEWMIEIFKKAGESNSNSGVGTARATDQAILVAFCPSLKQAIYTTAGGARSLLTGELNLLPFSGLAVETWIGFISENERGIATSIYTGEVTVS